MSQRTEQVSWPRRWALTVMLCVLASRLFGPDATALTIQHQPPVPTQHADTPAVPPEVLQAIYPQRGGLAREATADVSGENYFDQAGTATELTLGSSDDAASPDEPARFNEGIFRQMETASAEVIESRSVPSTQPLTSARSTESKPDQTRIQELKSRSLISSRSDETDVSQVLPATHVVDVEPADLVSMPTKTNAIRRGIDRSSTPGELDSNGLGVGDGSQVYRGPSLAEILADSNREQPQDPMTRGTDSEHGRPNRGSTLDASSGPPKRSPQRTPGIAEQIQRIAICLCLILAVACTLLLLAKRWLFSGRTTSMSASGFQPERVRSSIQILQQLKLDAKSLLYLVQANEQQVLVAVDVTGIKSVVTLNKDFETALSDVSESKMSNSRSIVQEIEDELGQPALYSPATLRSRFGQTQSTDTLRVAETPERPKASSLRDSEPEVELEMKRKLAEILRSSLGTTR